MTSSFTLSLSLSLGGAPPSPSAVGETSINVERRQGGKPYAQYDIYVPDLICDFFFLGMVAIPYGKSVQNLSSSLSIFLGLMKVPFVGPTYF